MSIPSTIFDSALKKIQQSQRFLITATASADGDSIGAQLALRRLLLQLKGTDICEIVVLNEFVCPERYAFLPDSETILAFQPKKHQTLQFDMAFVLDGGSERCGVVKALFDQCPFRVLVDHHRYGSEENYELKFSDPLASSTAEIVFDFFNHCRSQARLDQEMAAQLYLAMIFDTGFFRFSLTTPKTMRIGAELIATGIDFSHIAAKGMVETTKVSKRLLGEVLKNFKFENKGRLAWGKIPLSLIKKMRAKDDDHERIIENLCYIEGVEVAILFLELPKQQVKISFRSREFVDVGGLARSLGGGGHTRASGCTLEKTSLAKATKLVLGAAQKALKNSKKPL
jgi:phosphoesterase RecJ-like protein